MRRISHFLSSRSSLSQSLRLLRLPGQFVGRPARSRMQILTGGDAQGPQCLPAVCVRACVCVAQQSFLKQPNRITVIKTSVYHCGRVCACDMYHPAAIEAPSLSPSSSVFQLRHDSPSLLINPPLLIYRWA